jgi:hypothetical protein
MPPLSSPFAWGAAGYPEYEILYTSPR